MIGRYAGTWRGTGRAMNPQVAHIWTISDGKVTASSNSSTRSPWRGRWEPPDPAMKTSVAFHRPALAALAARGEGQLGCSARGARSATASAALLRDCARPKATPATRATASSAVSPASAPGRSAGARQLHIRLSRNLATRRRISLSVGGQRFELTGGGGDAWARDQRMDAAIVAGDALGGIDVGFGAATAPARRFTDRYEPRRRRDRMDAATVGCARMR
jgi:hypothetical protein